MLEFTCRLDSTGHLEAARDRKQGKTEYLEIVSELQRLGVNSHYETLELSVLGHYLPSSLVSLKNCVNFIQGVENFSRFKIFYWAVSNSWYAQGVKTPNGTITYVHS